MARFFARRGTDATWYRLDLSADSPEYVSMCLNPRFPERVETRDFRESGAYAQWRAAGKKSGARGRVRHAQHMLTLPEFAGYETLYIWAADDTRHVLNDLGGAMELLRRGLAECPSKSGLLFRLGMCTLDLGLAAETLYYWAQAVHNTESMVNARLAASDAYLELGHAAAVLGCSGVGDWFVKRGREHDSYPAAAALEITAEVASRIETVFGARPGQMRAVVTQLAERYRATV